MNLFQLFYRRGKSDLTLKRNSPKLVVEDNTLANTKSPEENEAALRELRSRIHGKKHKAFLAIHAEGKFSISKLGPIYRRLLSEDTNLRDDEILTAYHATSPFLTNTIAATEIEFASIATLCYFRPHLTEQLVRNGLLSFIWSCGDQVTADDVEDFINYRLLREDAEPYGGLPYTQGMHWLEQVVPNIKPQIQRVLECMIEQNKRELDFI